MKKDFSREAAKARIARFYSAFSLGTIAAMIANRSGIPFWDDNWNIGDQVDFFLMTSFFWFYTLGALASWRDQISSDGAAQ